MAKNQRFSFWPINHHTKKISINFNFTRNSLYFLKFLAYLELNDFLDAISEIIRSESTVKKIKI